MTALSNNMLETAGNTSIVRINHLAPEKEYVKAESLNPMASVKHRLAPGVFATAVRRVGAVLLVILAQCLFHSPAQAQAQESGVFPGVRAAVEQLDATRLDDDWYFSMDLVEKRDEGENLLVIESDPTRVGYTRRELVSVNGDPPDTERLEAFLDEEKRRIDDEDSETSGYRYVVDMDTLDQLEDEDGYARYRFVPRVKDLEKVRKHLQGTLWLSPDTGQINRLEIVNTEPLKPVFSVTVDTYRLELTFETQQGEQLLQTLVSRIIGTAGFIKAIDSNVAITFRDFKRAEH